MSHLYTSYETSLRLKRLGAPQEPRGGGFWAADGHLLAMETTATPMLAHECRAFRADEIIEALGPILSALYQSVIGWWDVNYELLDTNLEPISSGSIERETLVEALAAAWVAVLEAK